MTFAIVIIAVLLIILAALFGLALTVGNGDDVSDDTPLWTQKYIQNGVIDKSGDRSVARRTSLK